MVIMKRGNHPSAEGHPVCGNMGIRFNNGGGKGIRSPTSTRRRQQPQATKPGDEPSSAYRNSKSRSGSKMAPKSFDSLAHQSGEGPPIAPPNWKWQIGEHNQDMHFFSPSGREFRSKSTLAKYLKRVPKSPDPSLFCWKVTEEVMQTSSNQLAQIDPPLVAAPIKSKRKAYTPRRSSMI